MDEQLVSICRVTSKVIDLVTLFDTRGQGARNGCSILPSSFFTSGAEAGTHRTKIAKDSPLRTTDGSHLTAA